MNVVQEKSELFAIRIIRLSKHLRKARQEHVVSLQIHRSGTSIGANIAEAEYAMSKKDFLAKMYIAMKECAETNYWLKILYQTGDLIAEEFHSMASDCTELLRLLTAITKSAKQRLNERQTKVVD